MHLLRWRRLQEKLGSSGKIRVLIWMCYNSNGCETFRQRYTRLWELQGRFRLEINTHTQNRSLNCLKNVPPSSHWEYSPGWAWACRCDSADLRTVSVPMYLSQCRHLARLWYLTCVKIHVVFVITDPKYYPNILLGYQRTAISVSFGRIKGMLFSKEVTSQRILKGNFD